MRILITTILVLTALSIGTSTTYRVPQDVATIQAAINAAVDGDTVLVAEGTYYVNLLISKKIVVSSLYVIDKDTSHISKTILDGSSPSHPDTASVITIGTSTDTTTMIAGFTITNGAGTKMYLYNSGLYRVGGGINIIAGGATIFHNRIIKNIITGTETLPWAEGAGISIYPAVEPLTRWIIRGNEFVDNQARGSWGNGGGCYVRGNGVIVNNLFINNVATSEVIAGITDRGASGGGLQISSFGTTNTNIIVEGNLFIGNQSIYGSAITTGTYNTSSTTTVKFSNNIITRNTALATLPGKLPDNGPIHLQRSATEFVNNTIADNDGYCGIRIGQSPNSSWLLNNIVWNSKIPYQTLFASTAPPNPLSASYNCIYGGFSGIGNFNTDPQFVVGDTLYSLQATSPCINAGVRSATVGGVLLTAPASDYAGLSRPRPAYTNPDIGAIENSAGRGKLRVPQDHATIQAAINATVNGDTVLVSEGTYTENIKITKKIIVGSLFIIDGDKSHITNTIINGGSPTHIDSGAAVSFNGDTDTNSVIKGFTITGGKGNKNYYPTENVYFLDGAAVCVWTAGGARISDNIIRNNTLANTGSVTSTGAVVNVSFGTQIGAYSIIENNIICNNISNGTMAEGSAIGFLANGRITNNYIANNYARNYSAGFIFAGPCKVQLTGNYVKGNSSNIGGAIHAYYYAYFFGGPTLDIANCIFTGNTAASGGGFMHMYGCTVNIVNSTIVNNIGTGSAFRFSSGQVNTVRILNSIIWNPSLTSEFSSTSPVSWLYSSIRGSSPDPMFVSGDTLYRLQIGSPCLGNGRMSATVGNAILNAPPYDFLGNPRPNPSNSPWPDIGAIDWNTDPPGAVRDVRGSLPTEYVLEQNYPNPFNPSTFIRYALPRESKVTITIHDILGTLIDEVVKNDAQSAGWKEVQWNASGLSSGVYFYRLSTGTFVQTKKLIVLK